MSALEDKFQAQIDELGVPPYEREYWFARAIKRKWRFDFCWPELMLAVEVEGGTWSRGRHVRGAGFEGDCEKLNFAAMDGWCVLRFTSRHIHSGEALSVLKQALKF